MPIGNIQHTTGEDNHAHAVQPQPARISPLVRQQDGDGITRVKDSNGRSIGVKPITAIDMFDLTMAMGEHASNQALFRQAMVAVSAVEISGDPVARPSSMMTIRALITRLGFPGFVAVSEALAVASVTEAINPEAVKI
jgi:hypothetical protein